ncbi:hypothetical protein SK128_002661 [Halocaridina rubra]|uniref:LicD/FKTN/FKRP nucleotidyltransferase domain-containing protein n=1 Tax=Halocaridina rubra TaxID=373956 RepID=A0AAN8XP34_HALRR
MSAASSNKNKCPYMYKKQFMIAIVAGVVILLISASRSQFLETIGIPRGSGVTDDENNGLVSRHCSLAVEHRRRLAASLVEVQREIHRLAGKQTIIDAKWSLKIAAVAEELDPRLLLVTKANWDYSARLPDMPALAPNKDRHVCPEVYHGPMYDAPYNQHGMDPESCTYVPKFNKVLTVVLPAFKWSTHEISFVTSQIRNVHDIPIIAIVPSVIDIENMTNITIQKASENSDEAKILNSVVGSIKTPYVLMGTDLAHFSNQSSLERLVRVLDEVKEVKIVAGAARDISGHWTHGCLQMKMANYQAFYTTGYYHSKYECMYCDDILTPFVASVQLMKDMPFTKNLSSAAMYRDWFAHVRSTGHLSMVCPDVMFFVNNHTSMNQSDWLMIAKKWSLEKILSFDDKVYNFSCDSVGISCKNPLSIIRSYLLPPCCIAEMEKYLSYLTSYGLKHNLSHELQAGSALGAVKMGGYLPWDYDTDIVFECQDYPTWLKANTELKPTGCRTEVNQKYKYITVNCPHFFLELYCHHYNATSRIYLPKEYHNIPTTINYSGRDVIVSSNPGLHARNRMGIDSLKHAAHWRTLKVSSVGKAKGGYENPGVWNKCKNPKHHSCLDRHPGDGNLPFLQPFIIL